ncbi:type IX secretion system membrane protein PorP/SprF [Paracrocinitomix mangrovi]|uniref:PorP/SprF family type IX secretion system membrane protein n=1 Tax=Paracrocinitomix mangrovi TaxID=2862509 RepID=UPI001C8E9E3B|nr:type IX secretion system membrane protein PorP/SprF [Paracrocinitomix mangrovi]UKN03263.1 type IX secretion system membrane protein PorP/SprF [Paracrocinitomix mangrovi]
MKNLSVITALFMASFGFGQSRFHMTQYMMHQPFINPSSMGMYDNMNGSVFYKNQWTGFDGAPQLIGFNFNSPVGGLNNRLGFTVINDRIGVNNNTELSAAYAYTLKLSNKANLSFGVSATLRLSQSDYAEVETIITDPEFQANTPTLAMPNFKFGSYFRTKKFYVGFALPNLLKNTIEYDNEFSGSTSFDFSDWHFYLHSGYSWEISDKFDLNSSLLFKHVSGAPFQLDLSTMFVVKKRFGFGLNYRTSNDLAAMLRFRINPMLEMGYSYDYSFSALKNYSSGSHEIMLIFDIYSKENKPENAMPRY